MDEIVNRLMKNHANFSESICVAKKENLNEASDPAYITTKEEMKQNPTYKKIEDLCKKYGYVLVVAYQNDYYGELVPRVEIRDNDKYGGEIYLQDDSSKGIYYFTAQTSSYGSLDKDEYEKFLASCSDTYELLKGLADIDLSTLGIVAE